MKTFYMVTYGEYSEYQIVAVFDNKDEAEKMVSLYNGRLHDGKYEVEEVPFLSKCEEYNPPQPSMVIVAEYDMLTRRTIYRNEYVDDVVKLGYDYLCYTEFRSRGNVKNCDIYYTLPLTPNNVIKIEKIMADKIAKMRYELDVTHRGDIQSFADYLKSLKEEIEE